MRRCVTGADGYLGKGIVSKLLDCGGRGGRIRLPSRRRWTNVPSGSRAIYSVWKILAPSWAILTRSSTLHGGTVLTTEPLRSIEDLPKHCRFVEAVAQGSVKRICVMGSMHEVGYHEGPVEADTPCFPMSRYGIAKNALRGFTFLAAGEHGAECLWMKRLLHSGRTGGRELDFLQDSPGERRRQEGVPLHLGQEPVRFPRLRRFLRDDCESCFWGAGLNRHRQHLLREARIVGKSSRTVH